MDIQLELDIDDNKPLVTIEVIGIKVVQARIKNNQSVPDNLMAVINRFQEKLIPIN